MRVCIVGTGTVGLVTGACLAEVGHEVICVDLDPSRVEQVNAGRSPIFEPGLAELVRAHAGGRLRATTDLAEAVAGSEVSLVCVPTPSDGDGINLDAVRAASAQLGDALAGFDGYHVVAVKSTVVPGTTDEVVLPILEERSGRKAGADFGVGVNPEFLTEGQAIEEFMAPDRIVLGGIDDATLDALEQLYASFAGVPVVRTDNTTAEMIKYASNALLATAISFANELADLASALGVDAMQVVRGVQASRYLTSAAGDERVMAALASFLEPGCGFGGSCLPKDVRALVRHGERHGRPMELLEAVLRVNERRPDEVLRILGRHLPVLEGARVAVLGLAFKPDTDDVRVSPAIPIVERLLEAGAEVTIHDPVARPDLDAMFGPGRVAFTDDLAAAVREAQALVMVTRWEHYSALPQILGELDAPPVLVDGRRMLDPASVPRYDGIGL